MIPSLNKTVNRSSHPLEILKMAHVQGGVTGSVYCTTDDRSYQMSHWVSIPMIFVSAIFASLSRQMTRATLTAKMALTAKMRDCSRFMAWITLTAKMAANACS